MTALGTLKRIVHKIDRTFLMLMGEHKDFQHKLIIPEQISAPELRRSLIENYVEAQPSLLQVMLLKIYVSLRYFIGSVLRFILRNPRRES